MINTSEFSGLTGRQVAEQIIDSLKQDLGVDLLPIFENDNRSAKQRRHEASVRLFEALLERAENGADREAWVTPDEGEGEERQFLRAFAAGDVDVEPNLSIIEENVKALKAMRGNQIKDYLYSLTKRFENMSKATTPGQLAIEIIAGGLVSVGIAMAKQTYIAWKAGSTMAAALRTGITKLGIKTAIAVVIVALVTLLWWLFKDNPKKFLGLVINDTDSVLVVHNWRKGVDGDTGGDLYMDHGSILSFPQDYEGGILTKEIQIDKRFKFEEGDPENVCFGGIFFAEKNFGGYGAEGMAIFSAKDGSARFAHSFACPYSEDNGVNVRVLNGQTPDVKKLFKEMHGARKVNVETSEHGYKLVSSVNDARGGVTAGITCFSKI
ncbi:MAG: hypothetical protein M3P06_18160 [Acidobacteriota bacterium]|nr:hypothetical protein [Acidobacteriota bacterium]